MLIILSISFLALPQIAAIPETKEVTVGSDAVLPCLASGYPVPHIKWSKVTKVSLGFLFSFSGVIRAHASLNAHQPPCFNFLWSLVASMHCGKFQLLIPVMKVLGGNGTFLQQRLRSTCSI